MAEKRQYNAKRIFGNVLWALLGFAIVVLLGAAISLKNNKRCKGININISGAQNNFFIDEKQVGDMLQAICGGSLPGKALGSFNLAAIENTLKKNKWIKNAELFFDNNEVLTVEVSEREPVARIFTTSASSFYLDSTLAMLPLSDKTSARVPVFSNYPGQINSSTKADSNLLRDIKNISSYILKNPFWMAQIDQIDITADRTFEMIPKVGNQIIVFGNADNYEEKFNNLLIFYKEVATKVGWNKYSKINVQYKGQIVAVKRGTEDIVQDLLRTKQIMQNIILNAQKQVNDSIKNIQLDQQDDNIIPASPRFDDVSNEQAVTEKIKPVINPDSHHAVKTIVPEKIVVSEKKIITPATAPFWLQAATAKPANTLKKSSIKTKTTSNGKPNSPDSYRDRKRAVGLKSSPKKLIIKSPIKATTKPIIKPKTKPKAVMPPPNDY